MAKITKEEKRVLTKAEALSLVKNADGKVRFQVFVRAWLPTTEDRGFEGKLLPGRVAKGPADLHRALLLRHACGPRRQGRAQPASC